MKITIDPNEKDRIKVLSLVNDVQFFAWKDNKWVWKDDFNIIEVSKQVYDIWMTTMINSLPLGLFIKENCMAYQRGGKVEIRWY